MNKLLEVKEFDVITGNEAYKDDAYLKYFEPFDKLIEFIYKFGGDEETADVLDLFNVGYKRNIGNVITVKNYVGLIQLQNGYQIQVLPKINFAGDEDSENKKTKQIFLKMLKSMKDFPIKVFNEASPKIERMNLYEIFINMYLNEVRQLVKHGISSIRWV